MTEEKQKTNILQISDFSNIREESIEAEEDLASREWANFILGCRVFPMQDFELDLYTKTLLCMTTRERVGVAITQLRTIAARTGWGILGNNKKWSWLTEVRKPTTLRHKIGWTTIWSIIRNSWYV